MLYGFCTSGGRFRPFSEVKRGQNLQFREMAIHKFPIFQGDLWWARQGLNLRPHPCEGCALPLSYAPAVGPYGPDRGAPLLCTWALGKRCGGAWVQIVGAVPKDCQCAPNQANHAISPAGRSPPVAAVFGATLTAAGHSRQ